MRVNVCFVELLANRKHFRSDYRCLRSWFPMETIKLKPKSATRTFCSHLLIELYDV